MSIRYIVVIGIIVYTNITVDEEYIIYKYVKQKGAKYWPLWSEPCQYTWGRHCLGHTLIAYWSHYHKTSNMRGTLVGNIIVDHSDVVGTSPVSAAPTTSSFLTWHLASGIVKDIRRTVRESFRCWDLVRLILETWRYCVAIAIPWESPKSPRALVR